MKNLIPFACITTILLTCISCGDTSFSKVGEEFLNTAFGHSSATAEKFLSDDINIGWGYADASPSERKDIFLDGIGNLKDKFSAPFSDFTYRYGYTYDEFGGKYAAALYSYGTNKDYLVALAFNKDRSDEWKICEMKVCEIQDLINSYATGKEVLSNNIENGYDKDLIKVQKTAVKQSEATLKSIKDLMSKDQIDEFNKIKSSK